MRTLASIQQITNLIPIPNSDNLECASVLGWKVVVKKNEFKVGDLVIYCEIDSLMPERPEFEFLRARGMRIRTVRLRGQVSQGICFPVDLLLPFGISKDDVYVGLDVTGVLGVVKYEPPIPTCLSGIAAGLFPSFIPKTDETRVQVLQHLLTKYKGMRCYIAEKLDGSSVTYFIKDGEFGVCSRNLQLKESPDNALWKFARENDIENKLRSLNMNVAIQGEIVGPGIQGNKLKLPKTTVYFFNLFFIDEYRYASLNMFVEIVGKRLNMNIVPVIAVEYELEDNIDELVKQSQRFSVLNPTAKAEGFVIRPVNEIVDDRFGRVSFKVINPEFLIENNE